MDNEIFEFAKSISEWLRNNCNPHTTIEITDQGIKMTSVEEYIPTTKVENS